MSGDDTFEFFRSVPVLTLSDPIEAVKIAHALTDRGVSAFVMGADVAVAWKDLATADKTVTEIRAERPEIDWSKVHINWAKRTALPR